MFSYLNKCTVKLGRFREKISQLFVWSGIPTMLEKSERAEFFFVSDLVWGAEMASTFLT